MLPFTDYPLRPAAFAASLGPTLVLIPHPDDEALGGGGLLALLRQAGQPVWPVLVSDGTMSHPRSVLFSAATRRAVRAGELRHALTILGVYTEPLFLNLPDGQVPGLGGAGFAAAVAALR